MALGKGLDLVNITYNCWNSKDGCHRKVRAMIWPGDRPPPKLCHACKKACTPDDKYRVIF